MVLNINWAVVQKMILWARSCVHGQVPTIQIISMSPFDISQQRSYLCQRSYDQFTGVIANNPGVSKENRIRWFYFPWVSGRENTVCGNVKIAFEKIIKKNARNPSVLIHHPIATRCIILTSYFTFNFSKI